jgi:hypothetical protein
METEEQKKKVLEPSLVSHSGGPTKNAPTSPVKTNGREDGPLLGLPAEHAYWLGSHHITTAVAAPVVAMVGTTTNRWHDHCPGLQGIRKIEQPAIAAGGRMSD